MMHEHEKSDAAVGAEKLANKVERSAAEPVEQRAEAKGNVDQQSTRRAQDRGSVSQALERRKSHGKRRRKSSPRSSTISAPPCYGRLSSL
jgi:RNA-directed DNA polymerase